MYRLHSTILWLLHSPSTLHSPNKPALATYFQRDSYLGVRSGWHTVSSTFLWNVARSNRSGRGLTVNEWDRQRERTRESKKKPKFYHCYCSVTTWLVWNCALAMEEGSQFFIVAHCNENHMYLGKRRWTCFFSFFWKKGWNKQYNHRVSLLCVRPVCGCCFFVNTKITWRAINSDDLFNIIVMKYVWIWICYRCATQVREAVMHVNSCSYHIIAICSRKCDVAYSNWN